MVSCIICQDPAPCSQLPIAPLGNLKLVEDSLMSVELIMVLWLVTLPPPADAPPPPLNHWFPLIRPFIKPLFPRGIRYGGVGWTSHHRGEAVFFDMDLRFPAETAEQSQRLGFVIEGSPISLFPQFSPPKQNVHLLPKFAFAHHCHRICGSGHGLWTTLPPSFSPALQWLDETQGTAEETMTRHAGIALATVV